MANIKTVFGANVRHYRKKQGFTQEQLAEKLGITTKHLGTIETGAHFVSADLLEKFTKQFQVSASALFYSADEVSLDDSFFSQVDQMIDDEFTKISGKIKTQIRYMKKK